MKKLSLITGLLFSCLMHSQNPTFQWVKSIGGATSENGVHSTMDGSGNIYTIGSFYGTVDFDPGSGESILTSLGGKDIFVQKMDANGNFAWVKRMGGSNEDIGTSITLDNVGDILITGHFKGIVDFNPNAGYNYLVSQGSTDIFVEKLHGDGNFVWAKSLGGSSADYGGTIKSDETGNIFLLQSYSGSADFNPGREIVTLTSKGDRDICLEKLSSFGTFEWAKSIGGNLLDVGNSLTLDASGNLYVTGNFRGTADFDPNTSVTELTSYGNEDGFIEKFNSNGDIMWVKYMSSIGHDEGASITVDLSGNVYTTGSFEGTLHYFNPELGSSILTSAGGSDMYIQKINPNGNILWTKSYGGIYNEYGTGIYADNFNNIHVSAGFSTATGFNPYLRSINSNLAESVFLQKYDLDGNLISFDGLASSSYIALSSIVSDYSGNIFLLGKYKGTVDFDPGEDQHYLTSTGDDAMYVLKLSQNVTKVKEPEIDNDQLTVYPNPAKDKLTIKLGNTLDQVKVELFDLIGNLVYSENNTDTKEINIALNQPNGVYFINIEYNDKRVIKRLIIE